MARRYDREFKDRAVKLLADSHGNCTFGTKALEGVAKSLGIVTESLRRRQERSDTTSAVDSGRGRGSHVRDMPGFAARTRYRVRRRLFSRPGST